MRISYGEFLPDLARFDSRFTDVAKNVIPGANSYLPIPAPVAYSDALPNAPRGGWIVRTSAGGYRVFAATETTLHLLNGTAWDSKGTGLTGPGDEFWSGRQFGVFLYMVNQADGLYRYNIDTAASAAVVAGGPNASQLGVFDEYLFAANLAGSPNELAWCNGNDATNWSTGLSGGQTFPDGERSRLSPELRSSSFNGVPSAARSLILPATSGSLI